MEEHPAAPQRAAAPSPAQLTVDALSLTPLLRLAFALTLILAQP